MPSPKPFPLYTDGVGIFFTVDGVNFNQIGGGSAGSIPLTELAHQADQTVVGNFSGGSASPIALTLPQIGVDKFNAGAALTDAPVTVNPATDKASEYTLPAATLSANRVLTLGVTGSPVTGAIVQITRRDLTANTYTVKDDAGTTLIVFGASPTVPQGAAFKFDGSHYVYSTFFYIKA